MSKSDKKKLESMKVYNQMLLNKKNKGSKGWDGELNWILGFIKKRERINGEVLFGENENV